MLTVLDDLSLRFTGVAAPHKNQTESCAEQVVKMAQPLAFMALSMTVRAGVRAAGH